MSLLKNMIKNHNFVNILNNTNIFSTNRNIKVLSYLTQNNVRINECNTYGIKKFCTEPPKNSLDNFHSASQQPEKGAIYDKKPFKMVCEAGKKYSWCTCGKSKNQPLCDGTHKNEFLKIKLRPVRFTVQETKTYFLCNCKQTNNRPFCDGTHKSETVQGSSVRTN